MNDKGGGRMRTSRRKDLALLLALVVTLVFAACGGDEGAAKKDDEPGKTGGAVTIAQPSQPDFLDPASAYTVNAWEPLWLVYTPPLTY